MRFSRQLKHPPTPHPPCGFPATRLPVCSADVCNNGQRQSNFSQHASHATTLCATPAPRLKRDEMEDNTNFMCRAQRCATWDMNPLLRSTGSFPFLSHPFLFLLQQHFLPFRRHSKPAARQRCFTCPRPAGFHSCRLSDTSCFCFIRCRLGFIEGFYSHGIFFGGFEIRRWCPFTLHRLLIF